MGGAGATRAVQFGRLTSIGLDIVGHPAATAGAIPVREPQPVIAGARTDISTVETAATRPASTEAAELVGKVGWKVESIVAGA